MISENLRDYLSFKGWKPIDLARKTEIAQNTVSQILSGKILNPGANLLTKIVLHTDVSPLYLLTGQGDFCREDPPPSFPNSPRISSEETTEAYIQVKQIIKTLAAEEPNYNPPDELIGLLIHSVSETLAQNKEAGVESVNLSRMILAQLRVRAKNAKKKAK